MTFQPQPASSNPRLFNVEMSHNLIGRGDFEPGLFNYKSVNPLVEKLIIEKFMVEEFMFEKFGNEKSRVEAWV